MVTVTIGGNNDAAGADRRSDRRRRRRRDHPDPDRQRDAELHRRRPHRHPHHLSAAAAAAASSSGGTLWNVLTGAQITALTSGFTVDANSWDYTVANSLLQFLREGETITFSFTVTVTDNSGAGFQQLQLRGGDRHHRRQQPRRLC